MGDHRTCDLETIGQTVHARSSLSGSSCLFDSINSFILRQAGIASREYPEQLLIALEPEAASIYIRKLRMHQFIPDDIPAFSRTTVRRDQGPFSSSLSDQSSPSPFETEKGTERVQMFDDRSFSLLQPAPIDPTEYLNNNNQPFEVVLDRGTRYIVVDCGGGTVDITVHELDNQLGTLKELYKATGGPYGSVGTTFDAPSFDLSTFFSSRCRSRIREIDEWIVQ